MHESARDLIAEYANLICGSRAELYASTGLAIVEEKREGPYVYDSQGNQYLDLRTDSGTFNLGRRNPDIIRALTKALERYDIGNNAYFSHAKVNLARKLVSLSPERKLRCVSFHATGSEAVDFAVKLARAHTGREEVLASRSGFYGTSGFPVAANGQRVFRRGIGPVAPGFRHFTFNSLPSLRATISSNTAAVVLEPLESEGGVHVPSPNYFAEVRDLCDKFGALLILDEVLTGLGRTGRMLAIDRYGIVPDVITLGKGLSGGIYPIAACLYKKAYQEVINDNPSLHHSAFAGSDLGCVVAQRAIELTAELDLPDNAEEMGAHLKHGLSELQREHPLLVAEVRGRGLLLAVEMRDGALGMGLSHALRKRGVLASFLENSRSILRLMPALTIDEADVATIVSAFDGALGEIAAPARALELHVRQPDPQQRLVA